MSRIRGLGMTWKEKYRKLARARSIARSFAVPKYRGSNEDGGLRLRSETWEVVHSRPQEKLNLPSYCAECSKSSSRTNGERTTKNTEYSRTKK